MTAAAVAFPPGTRFRHPTQGMCTVYYATTKAVRYSFPGSPGFPPNHATTTPGALAALIDAGVIRLIPAVPGA